MAVVNPVTTLTIEEDIAVLAIDSPPVNALSHAVREGIVAGIQRALDETSVRAIVLICDGKTFMAGADISEFGAPPKVPSLFDVETAIENATKPVIAAIHGTALGGGFEVALCCHYRIAVPSAKCGLPEIHLGLIPGAGGTQRLPRLVGVEQAADMMLSGKHVPAPQLHRAGVIDELAPDGELRQAAVAFAKRIVEQGAALKKVRERDDKLAAARGNAALFATLREQANKKMRGQRAPHAVVRCLEAAVSLPFDEGLDVERREFTALLDSPESKAQRYVFFAERQVAKIPDIAPDTPTIPVARVGIVGAGTMGGGIAMCFANAGLPVTLVEAKQPALERGLANIRKNYESSAQRGRLTQEDVERRLGLIRGTLTLEDLADSDLVIEAVFEDMTVKKEVFGQLDRILKDGAILATNTSALDINEIASATRRPQAVLGLHFFSPANVMRLLEVVRAARTAPNVVATAMQLAKRLGKVGVLVGVCPGFVGNRMLFARQAQANAMLLEGAMPWDIDRVLYDFGMPMGPFAMADLAGLDLGWSREKSKSATVREVLCEMGRYGQKTGAGFYDYDEKRTALPSPVTERIVREFARKHDAPARALTDEEILERCLYPMINEGAKILDEGIALRGSDIDIVWINGYGWPAYRGGPMYYADSIGLDTVVRKLKEHAPKLGVGFTVAPLLERLAREKRKLSEYKPGE
jgi:3-hydroxyacyl-CoA dehydrogenase